MLNAFKKEFKDGYDDAIKAIKDALNGSNKNNSNNKQQNNQQQGSQSADGRDMDLSGTPAGDELEKSQGSPIIDDQDSRSGQSGQSGQSDQSGQSGQSSRGTGSQGVVTPEDCAGQFGNSTPQTPGGIMGSHEGGELAESEGYEKGPTADAVANDWREAAVKAAQRGTGPGSGSGSFASKILGIWKTTTDWKKAFKKIVGRSLNTQDKRSAFANKNALISRDMIARTEKDKYDCVDYICIFTDSSGSMSDDDLRYMLSEIYNIAYSMKPETLIVGQFDTEITDVQIFHNPQEFKKYTKNATVKGRGGTECKCIWDLLQSDPRFKRNPAELVLIMTDGELRQYKRNPKKMNNLCWVILDDASWEVSYKDARTTCIHLDSRDVKNH